MFNVIQLSFVGLQCASSRWATTASHSLSTPHLLKNQSQHRSCTFRSQLRLTASQEMKAFPKLTAMTPACTHVIHH